MPIALPLHGVCPGSVVTLGGEYTRRPKKRMRRQGGGEPFPSISPEELMDKDWETNANIIQNPNLMAYLCIYPIHDLTSSTKLMTFQQYLADFSVEEPVRQTWFRQALPVLS